MSATNIKILVRKIAALLPELEAWGEVYFFALGEREGLHRWEVIVSSRWSDQSYAKSVRIVADALMRRLNPDEMRELASISIIPSNEPNIAEMPKNLELVSPEEESIINFTLMGLEIGRAYIFKAQKPSLVDLMNASTP